MVLHDPIARRQMPPDVGVKYAPLQMAADSCQKSQQGGQDYQLQGAQTQNPAQLLRCTHAQSSLFTFPVVKLL
jgi:hypothetical protein